MKIIKQAHLRDVLSALEKEEITFSRAAEMLNDLAVGAVHQALDEAAEEAEMKFHDGHFKTDKLLQHIQIGANNITVDKDSILKLKEKY